MAIVMQDSAPLITPDTAIDTTQHSLACWSRACSLMANSIVAAGIAHLELTREMSPIDPASWKFAAYPAPWPTQSTTDGRAVLNAAKERFDSLTRSYRRINDDLAGGLFAAADILIDGCVAAPGKATHLAVHPTGSSHGGPV